MKIFLYLGLVLASVTADAVVLPRNNLRRVEGSSGGDMWESIICQVAQVKVEYGGNGPSGSNDIPPPGRDFNSTTVCITDNDNNGAKDMSYAVQLPSHIMDELDTQNTDDCYVEITNVMMDKDNAQLEMMPDSEVTVIGGRRRSRRRLAASQGENVALVLRVTYRGMEPTLKRKDLAGNIFGLGLEPSDVNLADQFEACSFGKLKIVPAPTREGIWNGVADITINEEVTGDNSIPALENLVIDAGNSLFGELRDQFDHVLIVLPDAELLYRGNKILAYAYLRGYKSVFVDKWAGRISSLTHEIAHNMNLGHAGDGTEVYGDTSGYMGYATAKDDIPVSCFNAQKNFQLGWYEDRALSLDINDLPWGGYLATFVDYNLTAQDQFVLLNVGRSNPRLFLQYNVAKGINAETRKFENLVTVVMDEGTEEKPDGWQSWAKAGINMNDEESVKHIYRYKDFDGNGTNLVIRVCGEPVSGPLDYVRISLHLDDGYQRQTCNWDLTKDNMCDDDPSKKFYVDEKRGMKDCYWLARNNATWGNKLCNSMHMAYHLCEETCGMCSDDCWDDLSRVFVANNGRERKCTWLSKRQTRIDKYCVDTHDAYDICPETCNSHCFRRRRRMMEVN